MEQIGILLGVTISLSSAASVRSMPGSPIIESRRTKRAIGNWFSGLFKMFQKKDRRQPMQYYSSPPSMYHSSSYQPSPTYGTPPMAQYGLPHEPHVPSYLHTMSSSDGYGGGQSSDGYGGGQSSDGYGGGQSSGGYGGGQSGDGYGGEQSSGGYGGGQSSGGHGGHQSNGYDGDQDFHSIGFGGSQSNSGSIGYSGGSDEHHGQENSYSENNGESNKGGGFGPIKNSDIISVGGGGGGGGSGGGSNNYQPSTSHHGDSIGISQQPIYEDISGKNGHSSNDFQHQDSYTAPSRPTTQTAYVPPHSGSVGFSNGGLSYAPPTNDIHISSNQYVPSLNFGNLPLDPQVYKAPLTSFSSSLSNENIKQSTGISSIEPAGLFELFNGRQPGTVILNGNTGAELTSPSDLGPYDPIIEIVFQDGDPAPPRPPPVIDPSYYEQDTDDVEVFFIEYSPEDEYDDFKNLDLSEAEPAILQNLPNELPYELRNHLLNSGILENAEIEIVDLESAIHDQSIDTNTRNALQAAYTRPGRGVTQNYSNNQAVDVRVKRLRHETDSPEGVADIISTLKKYRKGTYAGLVEINDKGTDKYAPVTIDGNKLPLPKNLILENKKVGGVLVLAPEENGNNKKSWPPTYIKRGTQLQLPSRLVSKTYVPPQKQKRQVNINWADVDSNAWVPIVNS